MILDISQIKITLNSPHKILLTNTFSSFVKENIKEDYIAQFIPVEKVSDISGEIITSNVDYAVVKEKGGYCRYFFHSCQQDLIYAKAQWDWKNKKVVVEYIPAYKEFLSESGNALFHIGLEQIMLREQRLIFHAACVDTSYGGILFTGPSGAGKSTQAELWVNHQNAFLINGDRPILSKDENGWKAWGSPYAGSSKCYVNKSCGIKAIVRVVKDTKNHMIRLKGGQAFSVVYSGVTVNDWSLEDVNMASELVIELVNAVPVYEMHCTNTIEAVEVLENVLKGEAML